MSNCLILLYRRLVSLGIFQIVPLELRKKFRMSSSRNFCLQIIRIPAPLLDKIPGLLKINLLSGLPVKLHQGQFNFLMSRITSFLAFSCTKHPAYEICIFLCNIKDFLLTCSLVISNSSFDHMSGCVQFVALHQIGPLLRRGIYGKISIQISIWFLCFPYQINNLICQLFQMLPTATCYGVGNRFQPFVKICVLENNSFSLSLFFTCGNTEIMDTIGRL